MMLVSLYDKIPVLVGYFSRKPLLLDFSNKYKNKSKIQALYMPKEQGITLLVVLL